MNRIRNGRTNQDAHNRYRYGIPDQVGHKPYYKLEPMTASGSDERHRTIDGYAIARTVYM